jgi:superkiller protein 3
VTLRADESDFQIWLRLAEAYAHAGRHVAALKALDQADHLSPADMGSLMIRGDVLRSLHLFGDAILTFTRALEVKPDDLGAQIALAGSLLGVARSEMATGYLGRAEDSCSRAIMACISILRVGTSYRGMTWKILGDTFYELSRRTTFISAEDLALGFAAVMRIVADADPETFLDDSHTSKAFHMLEDGQVNGRCSLLLAHVAYSKCLTMSRVSTEQCTGPNIDFAIVSAKLKLVNLAPDDELPKEAFNLITQAVRVEPMNSMAWNTLGILRFGKDPGLAQHSFIMAIEVDKKVRIRSKQSINFAMTICR